MALRGTVKHGVVILPPGVELPDGIEVEVSPVARVEHEPGFLGHLLALAKERDWLEDFALNHAHYQKGHPKKS